MVLGPLHNMGKTLSTREWGIIEAVDTVTLLMKERNVQTTLLVNMQMILWNVEERYWESGEICGRGSRLGIVDIKVVVGVRVRFHSGVGTEEDKEVEVKVEVVVTGVVGLQVSRVGISRIGAQVKIEVVMLTLV